MVLFAGFDRLMAMWNVRLDLILDVRGRSRGGAVLVVRRPESDLIEAGRSGTGRWIVGCLVFGDRVFRIVIAFWRVRVMRITVDKIMLVTRPQRERGRTLRRGKDKAPLGPEHL